MSSYALMTNVGRNKEAAALANGTGLSISHIAWGDGDRSPSGGETALLSEVGRKDVQGTGQVPGALNTVFFEILLDANEGPFIIREAGLIDVDGDLIAIAKYDPPVNKPLDSVSALLRIHVVFSDLENLILQVQSTDAYVPVERIINSGTGLTGGGDLNADRTLAVAFATEAVAIAGTSTTKVMSPKRVSQTIDSKLGLENSTDVYHSNKANPSVRMGSGDVASFDGLVFDSATGTLIAKAGAELSGVETGDARFLASGIKVTSTSGVSANSTAHPFELGDYDAGNGLKISFEKTLTRVAGVQKSVFWHDILQGSDITGSAWSIADAPNTWLIGENFKGDTAVDLDEVSGFCHRVGSLAQVTLMMDFSNFSIPASDDQVVSTNIDINAIAQTAGWFDHIIDGHIGVAYGRFFGNSWDAPWMVFTCSANSAAGTLYVATSDTLNILTQSSDADQLQLKLVISLVVGD